VESPGSGPVRSPQDGLQAASDAVIHGRRMANRAKSCQIVPNRAKKRKIPTTIDDPSDLTLAFSLRAFPPSLRADSTKFDQIRPKKH
jgi:hypothetical protein